MITLHFIYNRSTNMNYFIYTSHHFTARENMNSINWPHSHSSVGRASHQYSQRSRVRILLQPWFFQASPFQLLRLENLLWWSLFTSYTTAVQIQHCAKVTQAKCANFVLCSRDFSMKVAWKFAWNFMAYWAIICLNKGRFFFEVSFS